MTISEMLRHLRTMLAPAVGPDEARAMASVIVEDIKGYTPTEVVMYGHRELLDATRQRMLRAAEAVIEGKPLQYALGQVHWRGRRFAVNPSVLIPRPETIQLVDMIVDAHCKQTDLHVLDIGTGSGCIAVSLALDLPFSKVDALDISSAALEVAAANAAALKAKVQTIHADALTLPADTMMLRRRYDVIVSNPPYILDSERSGMDPRVWAHEPPTALFVRAAQPIAIYTAIAGYAWKTLKSGGRLYFEINPLCADMIVEMLRAQGFADVQKHTDYRMVQRFITCVKP